MVVFISMNTYILTEDTNFKKFLKENYPIALDTTKKILHMDLNMMLTVLMEHAYIA